jgi:branched-chain amino acid transport system permease protein
VVTLGVRTITAAALSGLAFALLPGVFQTYVPAKWGEVPALLFGLGAIMVARHPEGVVLLNGRQLRVLLAKIWPGIEAEEPSAAAAEPSLVGSDLAGPRPGVTAAGSDATARTTR